MRVRDKGPEILWPPSAEDGRAEGLSARTTPRYSDGVVQSCSSGQSFFRPRPSNSFIPIRRPLIPSQLHKYIYPIFIACFFVWCKNYSQPPPSPFFCCDLQVAHDCCSRRWRPSADLWSVPITRYTVTDRPKDVGYIGGRSGRNGSRR